MRKAFIFDMDGVIVDTERVWHLRDKMFMEELLGVEVAKKMPNMSGLSISLVYSEAKKLGLQRSKEEFYALYDKEAEVVYKEAAVTHGIDRLLEYLQMHEYSIGLVSSSPESWIDMGLSLTPFKHIFSERLSLNEHPELQPKPHPGGYKKMMELLQVNPKRTVILEDSNYGIEAGKNAGAYVIGFSGNLPTGYRQNGADMYASTMDEVIGILKGGW